MTDEMFDKFVEKTIENFGDSYIDTSLLSYEPHEFSARFERKMRKLIKKQRRFYFPLVKTPLRLSFTVIAMVILMTVTTMMSVGAVREAVLRFFSDIFGSTSTVHVTVDNQHPKFIEDAYEINYDLSSWTNDIEDNCEDYRYKHYVNDDKRITFYQYTQNMFEGSVINTEDADIKETEINGFPATYFLDNQGKYKIIWDNGKYIFTILANLPKEEVFEIAESVRKSE